MSYLPDSFSEFTSLTCGREQFIVQYLESRGVETSIIQLGDSRHIYVRFASEAYNPVFKIKTAIAHYDRIPQSPGSNDNSAAVWQLMDLAVRLKQYAGVHNMRIIFTDDEELGSTAGLSGMGAFGIAQRFKALGIVNDDVYVFDCCGRGNVFVFAKTPNSVKAANPRLQKQIMDFDARVEKTLRAVSSGGWMRLPVSYSDNAGFIAQGIPAALITLLPADEATRYARELHRGKKLEESVLANAGNIDPLIKEKLPQTWQTLHSPLDNDSSLTPESFALMQKLLDAIAAEKTMA
jgi:hypothetical protein